MALCCGIWVLSSLPSGPESHRPSQQFRIPCRSTLSLPWAPEELSTLSQRGLPGAGETWGKVEEGHIRLSPLRDPEMFFRHSSLPVLMGQRPREGKELPKAMRVGVSTGLCPGWTHGDWGGIEKVWVTEAWEVVQKVL